MRKLNNLAENVEISLPSLSTIDQHERFNTFSHFIAGALALCGCMILLVLSASKGDLTKFLSFGVYSISTVGLYSLSTLYHSSRGATKEFFRHLDHVGIFLKIAGNYTPYAILVLHRPSSWIVLCLVWSFSLLGTFFELFVKSKSRVASYVLYALASLTILPFLGELYQSVPLSGFEIIILGFCLYFIGAFFYFKDGRIKYAHELWHVFVVGGSLCHYLCLLLYVV